MDTDALIEQMTQVAREPVQAIARELHEMAAKLAETEAMYRRESEERPTQIERHAFSILAAEAAGARKATEAIATAIAGGLAR